MRQPGDGKGARCESRCCPRVLLPVPCKPYCLFNIVKDPREMNKLVNKEPDKLLEMIEHYNRHNKEPGEMQNQGYHSNSDLLVIEDACEYMAVHGGYWQPWSYD